MSARPASSAEMQGDHPGPYKATDKRCLKMHKRKTR
jgi:hypothetical protein